MNRKILVIVFLIMFAISSNAYASDGKIAVYLDGRELTFDTPPFIRDGTTLVPLRTIFESLGSQIQWDHNTQTVTAVKDDIVITYKIGDKNGYKDGKIITMEAAGFISNGYTLVPLRFVSESLGAIVAWNGESKRIDITMGAPAVQAAAPTETSYTPSINRMNGNETGSSYVEGDWIYYTHPTDHRKIYKMKLDGSVNIKVSDETSTGHLIVDHDWIYFSTFKIIGHPRDRNLSPENGVYKINTDGSGLQKLLTDTTIARMSLVGDSIYYSKMFDSSNVNLVRTDGTGNQLVYNKVWNYQIVGDTIYYNQGSYSPVNFYEMKLDGTNKRKLLTDISSQYQIVNNALYYKNAYSLRKIILSEPEKEPTKIVECESAFVVNENTVLFQKRDKKLYKADLSGNNVTLLHESAVRDFFAAGDFIQVTFDSEPATFAWINWKTGEIKAIL